jgi:polyribonucleotide nucleotidyltransferase
VSSIKKVSFPYGTHQVTIETGELARQAHGAVGLAGEIARLDGYLMSAVRK